MKSFFQTFLLALLVLGVTSCDRPKQQSAEDSPDKHSEDIQELNYHALVVGVSDYSDTGWPNLDTANADAREMGNILRSTFGFKVTELIDKAATRGNILRALDQIMKLTPNDALLVYFAGHGFYDEKMNEGYWIPHGAHRSRMNTPAKEDWLWNSSISRIVEASPARHILIVADTCYGGSLFRGNEQTDRSTHWYQRAKTVPSRYLITSGNLEPVLDSGVRHSVFAQEILNFLQYNEQEVFSASDIAVSIRSKVSQYTGQLVRMGPLAMPTHAGGEFIFQRKVHTASQGDPVNNSLTETVLRGPEPQDRAQELADQIETYKRETTANAFVRPRILACLGPTGEDRELTHRVRSNLNRHLTSIGGAILVERADFDSLLQEVELGTSHRADQRAATEIGKLLPASLILFGDIIRSGQLTEIHLRVVDTETSRVLYSVSDEYHAAEELDTVCQRLADRIMKSINQIKPLLLPAQKNKGGTLRAGWGRFHGARIGDTFMIITREAINTIAPRETVLGTAVLQRLGEEEALFQATWTSNMGTTNIWLKSAP